MTERAWQTYISQRGHSLLAQETARSMAKEIGFAETASEEIVLVVAELASNLLRHALSGSIVVKRIDHQGQAGIEIESVDEGPGIADLDRSLADGYSSGGGLGYGLGTVNRLMDEMEIVSSAGRGTQVVCRRWLRPEAHGPKTRVWDIGAATRSRRFDSANGDAYVVIESASDLLVGVIDGLGHGEHAQRAAVAAQMYVRRHSAMPLAKIFSGVDRACRGTRGVVMSLARLDGSCLTFAGVGNVQGLVMGGQGVPHLISRRDILGTHEPQVQVDRFEWHAGWALVLHSDGVRSQGMDDSMREPAQTIARRLIHERSTEDDDATVVVVKG